MGVSAFCIRRAGSSEAFFSRRAVPAPCVPGRALGNLMAAILWGYHGLGFPRSPFANVMPLVSEDWGCFSALPGAVCPGLIEGNTGAQSHNVQGPPGHLHFEEPSHTETYAVLAECVPWRALSPCGKMPQGPGLKGLKGSCLGILFLIVVSRSVSSYFCSHCFSGMIRACLWVVTALRAHCALPRGC